MDDTWARLYGRSRRAICAATRRPDLGQPYNNQRDNCAGRPCGRYLGWHGRRCAPVPRGWLGHVHRYVGISPTGEIAALAADQAGRIWIGGENGLTLYDRDRFVLTFNGSNSPLLTDTVTTLLSDRDNRLWIGSAMGLHVLDGSEWMTYTTSDGLPDDGIVDLAQTGDGLIFISTANGLSFYDGSGFTAVTPPVPATGLPLTVDELGRLWAGAALRTGDGWQSYYLTNSGLRSSTISDNAPTVPSG
ncbi:MAG: hypothetical protein HC893_02945, partial [Chloroflexaceae bacterium]|nr:hypothetical protein [Chloroflexaceae bacterium]